MQCVRDVFCSANRRREVPVRLLNPDAGRLVRRVPSPSERVFTGIVRAPRDLAAELGVDHG